jgi:hypothetical protein
MVLPLVYILKICECPVCPVLLTTIYGVCFGNQLSISEDAHCIHDALLVDPLVVMSTAIEYVPLLYPLHCIDPVNPELIVKLLELLVDIFLWHYLSFILAFSILILRI